MSVLSGTRNDLLPKSRTLVTGMLLTSVALSGCGLMDDRSEQYVSAQELPPLQLPEGADSSRISQTMPIRDVSVADASKFYPSDLPEPPDMTSEILEENYVVEELDGRAWLLVNDVPGRLWPATNAYMIDRGLGVSVDDPQQGLLQSELLNFSKRARELAELSDDAGADEARLVLQVRMIPGVRRKTTEIQVRRLEAGSEAGTLIPWSQAAAPSDEELAVQKRVLADMADFLKGRDEQKSFSRAASGIVSEPRVKLVSEGEQAVAIRMDLDYGRSWAEMRRALSEAGVDVVDLNRSDGWFHVDFRTEDERDSGWFGWFGDSSEPEHTHTLRLDEAPEVVVVTAAQEANFDGERDAADLLGQLFEYLY
ncbi:outer membrane protein assembly factor BamC [Marinobacter salinisoli]|uniref:Outer membrane protein assembly factor BamC n=1 Tax=Marinobacter salinisoli TaxID=2769486 RepID=A0ABX7MQG3_9GAMM|nr:outer membrane protein assembly factor BamC [Marinobacter salinisoli]QSP93650.1 outer membrane protein assembly factor BamC [Marinobacter salinisoli]